jgi:hypothetical protein
MTPTPLSSGQFGSSSMGSSMSGLSLPSSVDSTATSAGSTALGNSMSNAAKATTGITDFKQAGQSFSKGGFSGIASGIGHSVMGAVNAVSTAAMAVPGIGEGIKGLDIGLNAAVKGTSMFKAADATVAAEKASTASKVASNATHLNPAQFHGPELPTLYHGSGQIMKPGTVIKPGNEGMAFATTHRDIAASFANVNSNHSLGNMLGEGKASWNQPGIFNPVYEVKHAPDTQFGTKGNLDYATSQSGFQINKIHSWNSKGEHLTTSPNRLAQQARIKAEHAQQREKDPL